jgi:Predicted periplasmic lipoprotein (DUF2291)
MAHANPSSRRWISISIAAAIVILWFAVLPPFHVRPLASAAKPVEAFDAKSEARRFWTEALLAKAGRAVAANELLSQLNADPDAESRLGRRPGIGGNYIYLVRGTGTLEQLDSKGATLKLAGADSKVVLKVGPLFGNALRDSTGTFDLAARTSIEANALSAALNQIAETEVQPVVKRLTPGAIVNFSGVGVVERREGTQQLKVIPVAVELTE